MMNAKEMAAITATAIAEETENRRNKAKEMLNVIAEEAKAAADDEALKQVLVNYENKINDVFKLDANALLFVADGTAFRA